MDISKRIRCRKIQYRQGIIEVQTGIHDGCINIETFEIDPDITFSDTEPGDDGLLEDVITGNTEIELSLENAEQLVNLLQAAINKVKSGDNA